jgi:hypothetical protein
MMRGREKETRMKTLRNARRWTRRLPAVVASLIVAGIILTPAIGGAAAFLTKQKGDKRYLGNTSTVRTSAQVPASSGVTLTATCPPGKQAIGGGAESPVFLTSSSQTGMLILENKPVGVGRPNAWVVEAFNITSGGPIEITAVAVCAP